MTGSALLGPYSPCEALDSPLLDVLRDEEFLVSLTPDRSPVQRILPAAKMNTPDMIETTERLSRVLRDISIEGKN